MEGFKNTEGKPPLHLLDWQVLEAAALAFQDLKKQAGYSDDNHLQPLREEDLVAAIMRHSSGIAQGNPISNHGYLHSIHILLTAMILTRQYLSETIIHSELFKKNYDKS